MIIYGRDGEVILENNNRTLADSLAACAAGGIELSGARLRRARMRGRALDGLRAPGADLWGADLAAADLADADLSGSDLRCANLEETCLAGCDLRGADLRGAWLSRAILTGARLSGARLSCPGLWRIDLADVGIAGAIFVARDGRELTLRAAPLVVHGCEGSPLVVASDFVIWRGEGYDRPTLPRSLEKLLARIAARISPPHIARA